MRGFVVVVLVLGIIAAPARAMIYLVNPPRVMFTLGTSYQYAVDSDAFAGRSPQLALLTGSVRLRNRHHEVLGDLMVDAAGSIGWATEGQLAYAASLRIGTEAKFTVGELINQCSPCAWHRAGFLSGVRVDAIGDRVPTAWTVPLDAYWYREMTRHVWLGPVGGARFRVAGADRTIGWSAGIDVVANDLFGGWRVFSPRGVHITVSAERIADVTFAGVSISVSTPDRYDMREVSARMIDRTER
ncbi:MAG TPA: hypothetical protein VGO00_28855 [Kofleriaceae bacterium]|nr:hypothetical protein [Kofleriaceae bacterium]